jgi:hypothetical protein
MVRWVKINQLPGHNLLVFLVRAIVKNHGLKHGVIRIVFW